jgi:hypothetical protein
MKKSILIMVLAITSSISAFSKDKITLIQQIQESDTIPVFLMLGKIQTSAFDNQMTSFQFTAEEYELNSRLKYSIGFPDEYNVLLNEVCDSLNKIFNTNKFVPFPVENILYTKNKYGADEYDMVKMNRNNIVVVNVDAKYDFVYIDGFTRANDNRKTIQFTMQLTGFISVNFFHKHDETLRPDKISSTGSFVYGEKFKVSGLYNNSGDLAGINDPKLLIAKFAIIISTRLEKLAEKENKAYQKSLKN